LVSVTRGEVNARYVPHAVRIKMKIAVFKDKGARRF